MDSDTYKQFKKTLGYQPENSYWMIKNNAEKAKSHEKWKKDWDGWVSAVCWNKQHCHCHVKKSGMHFPSGLLGKAVDFFKANNIPFRRVDIRKKTPKSDIYTMSKDFETRDYQQDIIEKIKRGIDRGIVKCATGGGKTGIAAGVIAAIGVTPTVFYVPSIDLLEQTRDELIRFIRKDGKKIKVGMLGGGHKSIEDITVMTIQTAVRALGGVWVKFDEESSSKDNTDIQDIRDEIKKFIFDSRLMICDEIQHWAAETCQIISDASKSCQYRYGFSATPWRDQGDDILIDGCFGKCIEDISASFLIKKGHLVRPKIMFVKMDNMRGLGRSSYAQIYKQAIVENELRNEYIVRFAVRSRDRGRKVLILVKQVAHGKLLEKLIPDSIFLYGGTGKKKRKKHLDLMREETPRVTIASVIFDEGIDCRPLDTLILAGGGKSPTRALQRIGRILRPYHGKTKATAVDFFDACKYMQGHSSKREKIYKTEEEFEIVGDY